MKSLRHYAALVTLGSAFGVLAGCQHKKPVVVLPQQQPSTAAPAPSPTPEPVTTAEQPQEQPSQPQTAAAEQPKAEPSPAEKNQRAKKPSPRKPAQAGGGKTTEVARNSGVGKKIVPADKAEPTPTPGPISPGGGSQDQAATDQLLQSAESNLNGIKRPLTKDEEVKRAQVLEFISLSRKATGENDPTRAHTLAVKARLLSDELAKQP